MPSAFRHWMTQPVRLPGLPAKECALKGVRIVPEVIRRRRSTEAVQSLGKRKAVSSSLTGGSSSTLRES